MIPLVMLISVLSLAFAVYLAREVLAADQGTPQMQEIAGAIKEGAEAFLRRQNATIFVIGIIVTSPRPSEWVKKSRPTYRVPCAAASVGTGAPAQGLGAAGPPPASSRVFSRLCL